MKSLLAATGVVDRVNDLFGFIAKWLVLLACLVSAGNAIIRYLFSYSSNAWLEIQRWMFAGIVLLGASQTLRFNEHVRVDIIYSTISDRARLWVDILGIIFFLLPVTFYLSYLTVPFFVTSFQQQEFSNNAGGLILWPVKAVLPLGFILMFFQGTAEFIKRRASLLRPIEQDWRLPAGSADR